MSRFQGYASTMHRGLTEIFGAVGRAALRQLTKHEIALRSAYHRPDLRGTKAGNPWSAKPAEQSGLDSAPNPKWSPRFGESTQGRLIDVPRAQEQRSRSWMYRC